MESTVIIKVNKSTIENGNAEMLLNEVKEYLSNQPTKELYTSKKEKFTHFLTSKGFSQTPERFKVLEKVCIENTLFTFNTIHSRVLKDMYVSPRTINNTFKLLVDAKIIKRVNESNEMFKTTYFEIVQ